MTTLNPKAGINFTAKASDRTPDFTGHEWVFLAIQKWLSDPMAPVTSY